MLKNIYLNIPILIFSGLLLCAIGCQNPISVGGELLEDERIEVLLKEFKDFKSFTVVSDSIPTKSVGVNNLLLILGAQKNNIFGYNSAKGYIRFRPATVVDSLLRGDLKLDSLVLILEYGNNTEGNENVTQDIKVLEITQEIFTSDTFYSNSVLPTSRELGVFNKSINTKDSIEIINHNNGETQKLKPQLRLKLSDSFAQELLDNPSALVSDTSFSKLFKGLVVQADIMDESQSKIYDISLVSSRMTLFYTKDDTLKLALNFTPDIGFNSYTYNREQSEVSQFIDNQELGDSLVFFQGGGHLKTILQFSNLDSLEKLNINNVDLEVTINEDLINTEFSSTPRLLLALRKTDEGRYVFIDDIGSRLEFKAIFDGVIRKVGSKNIYRMNITNHLKKSIRDRNYNSDIYLIVETESANLNKGILYGSKHGQYPMRITITHTQN